jgi:formylglycine-generating enzyme required for sulfatase activity
LQRELDAEVSKQRSAVQSEASGMWSRVSVMADGGSEAGRQALEVFIAEYGEKSVEIGGSSYPVEIPEVAEAETWLSRYDGGGASSGASGAKWTGASGYEMVRVSAGSFTMGSPSSEADRGSDEIQHQVRLSRDYYVGVYEVTQGLWQEVMGENPSEFSSCGSTCPVEQVSWLDSVAFANALSEREGLEACYQISGESVSWPRGLDCSGYRLPTEAEWEYAARAGGSHLYSGSNELDAVGWYSSNSGSKTHPVGQKQANAWGLYDMSGNVYEWTWDWSGDYASTNATDPAGPNTGADRVIRGGSCHYNPRFARLAYRYEYSPSIRLNDLGLRLLRGSP